MSDDRLDLDAIGLLLRSRVRGVPEPNWEGLARSLYARCRELEAAAQKAEYYLQEELS